MFVSECVFSRDFYCFEDLLLYLVLFVASVDEGLGEVCDLRVEVGVLRDVSPIPKGLRVGEGAFSVLWVA